MAALLDQGRSGGDTALGGLWLRLDGADLDDLFVDKRECALAEFAVAPGLRLDMAEAAQRIERFHAEGMQQPYKIETAPGVECERVVRPIGRVEIGRAHV